MLVTKYKVKMIWLDVGQSQGHFILEIKVGNTEWKGIQHHQPKTIKTNLENIHHLFRCQCAQQRKATSPK